MHHAVLHFPVVTLAIIAANLIGFFLEPIGGDAFINHWSLVRADIMAGRNWITILTAMFMGYNYTRSCLTERRAALNALVKMLIEHETFA